jgi:serine/threonine protein kinase
MFIHELLLWRYLRHPNIVPFMGSCDTFGVCLVSQWMEGGTIDVYLRDHPEGDRTRYVRLMNPLSIAYHLSLMPLQVKDVVRGLAFMHSLDIVHGDLKAVRPFNSHLTSIR